MTKFLLALLLALSPLAAVPVAHAQAAAPAGANRLDGIVAVVDDDIVLRSELDRAVRNIKAQYAGRANQLPPEDELEKQVLERLVLTHLQLARAENAGIKTSDADVDQSISQLAAQNKITPAQLQQRVAAQGMNYDEFRKSVRDELTIQKLQQKVVEGQLAVSDTEIDNELATQRAGGPQIHLAHILVGLPPDATPDQVRTAQKKIEDVRDLIVNGKMDFSAAAIRYSDSQNALEGGDLGWRSLDEVPPAFATVVKTLKPGDVTQPIRGSSGFQLLKLVEVRQAGQSAPQQATEYHALDLMVKFAPGVSNEQTKAKIDALRAQIVGGADFGDVARKDSDDTETRAKGGDMGWFPIDGWGTAVAQEVQKLKDGEVSQPFQSNVGWHVIKLLATRTTDVSQQAAREAARDAILRRKAGDQYDTFLRQIRSEAYVDIRLNPAS
ncbi:MAG: peptidylprolyl isomerase [Proteobacteria bacterium]|nr:peptidylprolyl isomerase [Pseudomonadota bacterium]MBS0461544.1 peptidylprolyl isomerase [Pseudomonadota bacterium]MBS0464551.1 peptidylprolyl isomerase [Pseudomonadota bacterium]